MVTATLMFEHFINLNFDNTDVELYKSIVNKNISKSESAGEVLEFLIKRGLVILTIMVVDNVFLLISSYNHYYYLNSTTIMSTLQSKV